MVQRFFSLLIVGLGLSACIASQGRGAKLREAVFYFNEGVRWGRVQDVVSRLDPGFEDHFREMHKDFGNAIQITDYEMVEKVVNLDEGKAYFAIKITWYRINELLVRETILGQYWEENELEWYMVREEYKSGTPFS